MMAMKRTCPVSRSRSALTSDIDGRDRARRQKKVAALAPKRQLLKDFGCGGALLYCRSGALERERRGGRQLWSVETCRQLERWSVEALERWSGKTGGRVVVFLSHFTFTYTSARGELKTSSLPTKEVRTLPGYYGLQRARVRAGMAFSRST